MWQDKRAAIAQEVDGLGDQFCPAMSDGWLVGFDKSRARIFKLKGVQQMDHALDRALWSWTIKDDVLLLLQQWKRISGMKTDLKRSSEFWNNE